MPKKGSIDYSTELERDLSTVMSLLAGPKHPQDRINLDAMKSTFTNHIRTKHLVRDILVEYGADLQRTYFDVPRLRVAPHGGYLSAGVSYAYKAHRDTWYSSPHCQVNYWTPVFQVTSERAMSMTRMHSSPVQRCS